MEQTPWKQEARARAGKKCELRSTSLSLFLCVSLFLFLLSCLSPSHQINPLLESYTKWIRCNYCNIKAQTVQNPPAIRGDRGLIPGSDPWVRKIPWRRKWQPAPVILPGKSHGQRSLAGYNPWGRKELDTIEQLILSLFFVILTTILSVIVKNQKLPRRVKAGLLRTCGSLDDGLPGGSMVKNLPANAEDLSSIHGSGRSLGEGNDNPLQYSCLENPMDRGAWRATVHGVAKELDTTEQLTLLNSLLCHRRLCHNRSWYLKILPLSPSVMSDSLWSCGLQPDKPLCPWDYPGKNTGMSLHFLLQGICWPRDWILISYVSCIGRRVLYHQVPPGRAINKTLKYFLIAII